MGMPHATLRWTAEMVRTLPDDGNRYEVVDGALLVTPAPNPRHQRVVGRIQFALARYLEPLPLGELLASPADISTRADRLVQPDLFVVPGTIGRIERWSEVTHLLLAVEVLSPSSARADRGVKRRYYAELADEYWIVDLDARLIERWRPGDDRPEIITERLSWRPSPDPATPPFVLELAILFEHIGDRD